MQLGENMKKTKEKHTAKCAYAQHPVCMHKSKSARVCGRVLARDFIKKSRGSRFGRLFCPFLKALKHIRRLVTHTFIPYNTQHT
ncbi:uncharacterized protein DS421_14g464580 [Arachis hypogaea]|nr:uncharacterized protein DS421_14g464580 [Arachis hypogaea]